MFYRELKTYSVGELLNEFTRAYTKGYNFVSFELVIGFLVVDVIKKRYYMTMNLYGFNPSTTFTVQRQLFNSEVDYLETTLGYMDYKKSF